MSQAPEDDAERTIVRPPSAKGAGHELGALGHTLPVGTRVRDFEITGLIGEGGFGIVYLAYDHSLERRVAVKEYMPSSMASRVNASATVMVKSDRHRETFTAGLKSFVNEARLLARFDHPALVKVYRFWEENGTAYMVMPYYEGPTLKSALAAMGKVPDEAALRAWLRPLLDALSVMHAAQCYHRDIAPDNILLTATGPLLLDFGAARRVIGDMTHALTVVLKPGYAPIEQYGDVATMTQGAWTDLYALACVVYFAITGKVPMSSVERLMDDRLEPLRRVAAGRYSEAFLHAIDAALAVRPQDRPQTDAQFRELLDGPGAEPARSGFGVLQPADDQATRIIPAPPTTRPPVAPPRTTTQGSTVQPGPPERAHSPSTFGERSTLRDGLTNAPEVPRTATGAVHTGPATLAPTPTWQEAPRLRTEPPPVQPPAVPVQARSEAPSRTWLYLGTGAVGVIALAFAAIHFLDDRPASEPPVSATPASPNVAPVASAPASVVAVPAPQAPAPAAPVVVEAPAPSPTLPPPEAVPSKPTEPVIGATPRKDPAPEPSVTPKRVEPAAPKPPPTHAEPPVAGTTKPERAPGTQARCSDILQKASLEPLTAEEAGFLKRECR